MQHGGSLKCFNTFWKMYGREDEDETGFDTNKRLLEESSHCWFHLLTATKKQTITSLWMCDWRCAAIFLFSNYLLTDLGDGATDGLSAHVNASVCLGADTPNVSYIAAGWKHHAEVLWDLSFSVTTNTYWSCGKHFWHIHQQQQSVVTGIREVWWVGDLQR